MNLENEIIDVFLLKKKKEKPPATFRYNPIDFNGSCLYLRVWRINNKSLK